MVVVTAPLVSSAEYEKLGCAERLGNGPRKRNLPHVTYRDAITACTDMDAHFVSEAEKEPGSSTHADAHQGIWYVVDNSGDLRGRGLTFNSAVHQADRININQVVGECAFVLHARDLRPDLVSKVSLLELRELNPDLRYRVADAGGIQLHTIARIAEGAGGLPTSTEAITATLETADATVQTAIVPGVWSEKDANAFGYRLGTMAEHVALARRFHELAIEFERGKEGRNTDALLALRVKDCPGRIKVPIPLIPNPLLEKARGLLGLGHAVANADGWAEIWNDTVRMRDRDNPPYVLEGRVGPEATRSSDTISTVLVKQKLFY
jgi:hypothetical protein